MFVEPCHPRIVCDGNDLALFFRNHSSREYLSLKNLIIKGGPEDQSFSRVGIPPQVGCCQSDLDMNAASEIKIRVTPIRKRKSYRKLHTLSKRTSMILFKGLHSPQIRPIALRQTRICSITRPRLSLVHLARCMTRCLIRSLRDQSSSSPPYLSTTRITSSFG